MTRVYGNSVTNTSGGHTRTWRLYADYTVSSTETSYTVKGTSIGVQNTASESGATMGFNANSLTVSYSGVLTASYKRTTKTGNIKGGATFEVYGTDLSAVIERTRVRQTKSLTFKCVANSNTVWDGTSTKTVSFTIPARSSHTVSYDANGGSGSIPSFTKFYSATGETAYYETLSDGSGFSKVGYRVAEWNTMPDGSGTSYPISGYYTANGTTAVTLYAQWQATYVKPEIQNLLAFRTADASGGASPTVTSTGETGFCKFELVGGANYTFTSASVQFGTATAKSMTQSGTTIYGYSDPDSIAQASAYTVKITVVITGIDGISRTYTDSTYISKSVPVFDVASNGNCFAFFGTATDGLTDPKLIINGEMAFGTEADAAAARSNLGINASNLGIKDYIIEQGEATPTSSIKARWEKWASGKAVMEFAYSGTATASNVWATPIYYTDYTSFSNVFANVKSGLFIEPPSVIVTSNSYVFIGVIPSNITANGIGSLRYLSVNQKDSSSAKTSFRAVGKWK